MSFAPIGDMMGRRKNGFSTSNVDLMQGDPSTGYQVGKTTVGSPWHPRNWGRKTFIALGVALVVIIVAVVVGAVEGTKSSKYPDYTKLTYTLKDTYSGSDFFDNFNYFSGYDPAAGFVHYVDGPGAAWVNLTHATNSSAVLKVDTTANVDSSTGRRSVRVESKNQYNSGLFVFDILHTPYGCGTWPALWLADPANWPTNGEIDVVEAVNTATTGNQMTLHTTKGCTMNAKRKETGTVHTKNCWNGTDDNTGCAVLSPEDTYGEALNQNGGGVYAMEWRTAGIRVWFFPRASIPSDISTDSTNTTAPDPSTWGEALADFPSTDCDISTHFRNQSIIANIDLCGSWASSTAYYTTKSHCPGNCTQYVTDNPSAFTNAYWEFASFKIYQAS
ncbi:MAG: hypothetical protein M1819_002926 [Sarea resinae]|nr:MAG: hypothetical protein M1819_002926 [Sarea resinae]